MKLTTKTKFENYEKSDNIFDVTSTCRQSETINDERTPLILKNYCYNNVKQVFGFRRSSMLFFLYLIFYTVFLIAGGIIFTVLESPEEEEIKESLVRARHDFLNDNNCVQDKDLEELIEKIIIANGRGVSAVKNVTGDSNWSFGQSLFFSSTIVTTIGYGQVTPLSKGGKCFCIIYAMLGIPLTLMLLTAIVQRLMVPSNNLLKYLVKNLNHLLKPLIIKILHLVLIGLLYGVFFILIPGGIFTYLESDWDFMDSIYYCFISLTTIGLGDYVPGDSLNQPHRDVYKIITTGYLFTGLTFLVFTLSVFYEIPQLNLGIFFLMESDEMTTEKMDFEKSRVHDTESSFSGLKYTQNFNDGKKIIVNVKSRKEDTPSPEQSSTSNE